jgi:hypothetical protein
MFELLRWGIAVDQQFEGDISHDLMADSPTVSADETFEEASYNDSFEGDEMDEDDRDQYDEEAEMYGDEAYFGEEEFQNDFEGAFEDEFTEQASDGMDSMEEVVANALDAKNSDEFIRRLISGIRGTSTVGRVAKAGTQRASATKARSTSSGSLQQLLPLLQRHVAQGANEMDMFEELADLFEQENMDEALTILGGVVARVTLRPLVQRSGAMTGQAVSRQLVRGATQAARNLISRQGVQAVRALRPIAISVGRVAVRRGMKPTALPSAIRRAAATVAAQPALARRLAQTTVRTGRAEVPRSRLSISGGGVPRRFVVNGPVEIIIRR